MSSPPGEPEPVVAYIEGIQNIPALAADEAATLASVIKRGEAATKALRGGLSGLEADTAVREERNGEAARKRLIEANLHVVVTVAWTFEGRGTPLIDLIQEGNVALVGAVERMGSDERSFASFARRRIKEAIGRAVE